MSKPLHQPTEKTRAEIIALRSYGVPIKEVAAYIGIDDKTLYKYYREELENSAIKANANVGKFLYQAASGQALTTGATYSDCVRAAMFWAKTRMGWKETNVQEHTGKVEIQQVTDLTDEELDAELAKYGINKP